MNNVIAPYRLKITRKWHNVSDMNSREYTYDRPDVISMT